MLCHVHERAAASVVHRTSRSRPYHVVRLPQAVRRVRDRLTTPAASAAGSELLRSSMLKRAIRVVEQMKIRTSIQTRARMVDQALALAATDACCRRRAAEGSYEQ